MAADEEKLGKSVRRQIPGSIPYTTAPGKLKEILEKAIGAERPSNFNADFMEKILGFSGGSATQAPPILKRAKLLEAGGQPTELYSKFKTTSGRSQAAYLALRNAFPSVFAKSEYAHKASREQLTDLFIEITGLEKDNGILRAMLGTFEALKSFVGPNGTLENDSAPEPPSTDNGKELPKYNPPAKERALSLSNHIHIVLPNTTDISVFNSIFKSLKENLLDD